MDEITMLTQTHGKIHHEWQQCFNVQGGREQRMIDIVDELIRARPDAVYVRAWAGQVGTTGSCADLVRAWPAAIKVIRRAQTL